jgi:hypothetical protein
MANDGIIGGTKDEGECHFDTDLSRGKITVTVRSPLSIDKRSVEIGVTELLEVTAQVTVAWIGHTREMYARAQRQLGERVDTTKEA